MTTKLACSYAILKFLPYAETGEFVNIGVALVCPAIRFFGVRTTHRVQRVNNFFKELDPSIYRTGLAHFKDTVHDIEQIVGDAVEREQMIFPVEHARILDLFRNFTCPREAMFQFGGNRAVLAANPEQKLEELYCDYVERQFAKNKQYQEQLMEKHLRQIFIEKQISRDYRSESLGNDRYSVPVPFVHYEHENPVKAIKPLDLDKDSSTKIFEHGDQWITRVRRLRDIGAIPERMLFVVRQPSCNVPCVEAAQEIQNELQKLEMNVVPFTDEDAITDFAKISKPA